MSATYIKVKAPTEKEAREKAQAMIKEIDYMRQPSLYSVQQDKEGNWEAIVKQWGLD